MQLVDEIADILTLTARIVMYFRQQNHHAALRNMAKLSGMLMNLVTQVSQEAVRLQAESVIDQDEIAFVFSEVVSAQEKGDYILLADLLEMQLLPFLMQSQERLVSNIELSAKTEIWEQNLSRLQQLDVHLAEQVKACMIQEDCHVEPTSSGLWTLNMTDQSGTYYFHTNVNPRVEAEIFAKQYYSPDCVNYLVFGLGLGYHIKALPDLDDGIYIDVIEPDLEIIRLANIYTDLSWLYDNPRIRLWYDADFTKWKELLKKETQLIIHYPSLRHVSNPEIKLSMEKFFIQDSGRRNFRIQMANNFRDNVIHCDGNVDELKPRFQGKNVIIVAAGPSLDKNVKLLLSKPKNTLILAVGTVFRKLLRMQIIPDFVIFLDAQPHLYRQIEGLEKSDIPILCASTACKKIAAEYGGKKYLICQDGYDHAEVYAKEHGYQIYRTGGSVSTIALDVSLRLGCKEVAYIGLDLAFTNDLAHTSDTSEVNIGEDEKTIMVPDANGGKVATRRLFLIYQEWIERRATEADAAGKVFDATEGGAIKKGLKVKTLAETLAEWGRES